MNNGDLTDFLLSELEQRGIERHAALAGLKHFGTKWWLLKAGEAWDVAYKLGGGLHVVVAKTVLDIIADEILEAIEENDADRL